jgi:hypothetical protein
VVVRSAPSATEASMGSEDLDAGEDAQSLAPLLGYGWRLGPAPASPWYLTAGVQGTAATEARLAAGHLVGFTHLGIELWRLVAEAGVGFGAIAIGSLDDAEVAPAAMAELAFGLPITRRLRGYLLRVSGAAPVIRDRGEIDGSLFLGIGVEWTPDQPSISSLAVPR